VVGNVTRYNATLDAIRFISRPSDDRSINPSKHHFRVATAMAAPFVQEASKFENETCLIGTPCLKVRYPHIMQEVANQRVSHACAITSYRMFVIKTNI